MQTKHTQLSYLGTVMFCDSIKQNNYEYHIKKIITVSSFFQHKILG